MGRDECDREPDESLGFREIQAVVNSADAGVLALNCYEVVTSRYKKAERELCDPWDALLVRGSLLRACAHGCFVGGNRLSV